MEGVGEDELTRTELPEGTVTLVLADVETSVRRIEELVDAGVRRHGGGRPAEQAEGNGFAAAFSRASSAVAFALELQIAVSAEIGPAGAGPRFRMAVHSGELDRRDDNTYVGPEVDRCARVRDLGRRGQILLTQASRDLVVDRLPDGATLRELGVHALQDIARPERIFAVVHPALPDEAPTVASSDLTRLPRPLTSFVGRAAELDELGQRLRKCRVLTLTGAGGTGKTRLALECAHAERSRYRSGARWVDLSATATGDLVAFEVAATLRVSAQPGAPADTLVEYLRDEELLLVVDNCEHLTEACSDLVEHLVSECAELTVVATSREPLGVTGETAWRVGPLVQPAESGSVDDVAASEAGQLFIDRARRVRSDFCLTEDNASAITTICRRLDGIPLAIELAAARVQTLSPERIVASLDDRFRILTGGPRAALPRQRTLEASVAWSYELLSPQQRLLLARLSVFVGSFDLEVVERVCSDEDTLPVGEVLDVLAALVERSMVVFGEAGGPGRYSLLETVRVYADTKLVELDQLDRIRDRHLDAYVEVAERVRLEQLESVQTALATFDAALDNLRTALDWAVGSERPRAVLQVIGPTFDVWLVRGLYTEATTRLRDGLSSPTLSDVERARGLADAAMMTLMAGDYDGSFDLAEASVALAAEHDDPDVHARSHAYRAWSGFHSGRGTTEVLFDDLDRARTFADAAGDPVLSVRVTMMSGWVEACGRSVGTGRALLEAALSSSLREGTVNYEVPIRRWLGSVCMFAGDAEAALAHSREAIRLARDLGYDAFVADALTTLGNVEGLLGDLETGRRHLIEAIDMAQTSLAPFALGAYAQRALGEALLGSPEEAARAIRSAEALLGDVQFGTGGADFVLLARGLVAYRSGERALAATHLSGARDRSSEPLVPFHFAIATLWLARIAADEHRTDEAWELAHQALAVAHSSGNRVLVPAAVETLAAIAGATGRASVAARLLGAASRIRAERVVIDSPPDENWRMSASTQACQSLGDEDFDRFWAEGREQSEEELISYAQRGRGTRGRPAIGWDSLTPAERRVIDLVIAGCTNAEVSQRLFVSINTVRTHLSHVYTKLGVANRTELAAEAARRS